MTDAYFTFDTNIEAVVRRVRTGFQELSRTVAQQAAAGGNADPAAAEQLERRLSTSIQRAARELAQVRAQFEGALRDAGQGGDAARPNGRSLKSEGEQVLNRLRGQLINDLTDFGRQFDLPEEQVRATIVQGVGQLQAGFKSLFLAAREDLRRIQGEIGATATAKTFYGSSGLDTTRGLSGDLKEGIQRETRERSVTTGPQDLLQAELALAQRQARAVFREAVAGAINPADARATAEALDAALKKAIRDYVDAVRAAGQRASAFGVEAPRADEGLRGLTDQALRARAALGIDRTPIAASAFPTLSEVKPVRNELKERAAAAADAATERFRQSLIAAASASDRAAAADDAEAAASRRAAVEASKARAGLTERQIEKGRDDDLRATKGAELERRLAQGDPRVTYGRQRSEVVELTDRGPEVYQISRQALGPGSLIDPEGRRHTLATRLAEDAEANAIKEYIEKFRAATQKEIAARERRAALADRNAAREAEIELRRDVSRQRLLRPDDFSAVGRNIVDLGQGRVFTQTQQGQGVRDVEGPLALEVLTEAIRREAAQRQKATDKAAALAAREEAARQKVLATYAESEARGVANRAGSRIGDAFTGRDDQEEYRRLLREETKAQALTLAAVQRGREAAEVSERLRREVNEGLSRQVASNRFLTPRGLEDAGGQRVYDPAAENAYRLNEAVGQRLLTGQASDLGGGLVLDQALGRFVQVANNKAQVLQGAVGAEQATRLNAAIERLRREADEAARRVATAGAGGAAGGGGGGRTTFGGQFIGGFAEGFNSAGFAGGRGSGDLVENLSRTAGLEARFFVTYRALLLVQQGLRDTVEEYLRLSEAERNLEIALGTGAGVSDDLRDSLTDVAAVAGESVSTAMDVAARGVRAFTSISTDSAEEIARVAAEFAEAAETLSVIAQQSLEESANEVVATAQSFNLSDFGNIAEVVAEARRLGGDPDEISSGLANIGVAAREAGLDVRETAAIISSAVAQTGQSGQAVATRLSRVFNTLRGSTGRNLLSGLGIDIEQQPIDQLRDLADTYEQLSELDQRAVASRLAGVSNIREFTVLLEGLQGGSRVQQVVAEGFSEGGEAIAEYNRRLESAAGQVQLIVGQIRELQQAAVEAGALDLFGAALALAKPFLQTINDLLDLFNGVVGTIPGLNRVVTVVGQVYLANRLLVRLRQESVAATATETGAQESLTTARQRQRAADLNLAAGLRALSVVRGTATAATDAETQAILRNTAAKQGNAVTPFAPPIAGTGTGAVPPVPPASGAPLVAPRGGTLPQPPGRFGGRGNLIYGAESTLGRGLAAGRALLGSYGPAIAITAAVVAFQSLSDALERVTDATEGANEAVEARIRAEIQLSSAGLSEASDTLRNQAAQIRDSAGGITGGLANFFASLGGESLNEQAGRLEAEAQAAAREAERRRQTEIDRVSQLGEGETIFGSFLDGAEELRIGLETLDEAGANAVTKVEQVVQILERMAAIQPGDFTELDRFDTQDLAASLSAGLSTILAASVEDVLSGGSKALAPVFGKDGAPDISRGFADGLGESLNTIQEVERAINEFRINNNLGIGTDASRVPEEFRERLLALEGLRDLLSNEELLGQVQEGVGAIVEQVAGPDGVLSAEQYQDVIDQAAALIEAQSSGIDGERLRAVMRQYLESFTTSAAPVLNEEQFREAADAVLQNLNAIPNVLQLAEGLSPVESLEQAASYIESLRAVSEQRGFDFTEELELAYLQLTRQLEDAQDAVAAAQRGLTAAELPSADVAGRRALELEGLEADLARARSRNDEEAVLNTQADIAQFIRETAEVERERIAAVERSALDIRDTAGRLQADIDAARARLDSTAEFDSDGNTTQAFAEANEEIAQLLFQQAQNNREVAAAARRASIDPRDDLAEARADLKDAEANLEAQLEGTEEYYEAQRGLAEARLALTEAQTSLANASERAAIDPRDDVRNAAQDVREAQRAVDEALPGTVAFFEALRGLQEAQLAFRDALNARQDAQRRASLDPRDDIRNAEADVKAAQDDLDAALPGTQEYYEAQRRLAESRLSLAEEQRRLTDAMDLAGVEPGDVAAEAAARLRIARRALAAALPGTVAFYEALREVNEAQAALAEEQAEVEEARDAASVAPGDEVGQAALRIRQAARALRRARSGSREYYEALRELNEAKEAYADAQAAVQDAAELAAVTPGDDVAQAQAELRIAERALRRAARGTREFYEALARFKQAQEALKDAIRARADARDLANVFPGSEIDAAAAQLRVAERALNDAQVGTAEYYQALGQVREAQVALARAQANARGVGRLLGTDLTNPVAEARAQIANLGDMLHTMAQLGAPGDVLDQIRLQIKQAKNNLDATLFSERLSLLKDLLDIGAISDEQYISRLKQEKRRLMGIRNRTYQENKQLIEVEKAIQAAEKALEGQFNIGDIRVPTPYEVRRAVEASIPGLNEIRDAAGAFGTGGPNDPLGYLMDESIIAVDNLSSSVLNFGNLVGSIFAQLMSGGGGGGGGAGLGGGGSNSPLGRPSSPSSAPPRPTGPAPSPPYQSPVLGVPGSASVGPPVLTTSPGPTVRNFVPAASSSYAISGQNSYTTSTVVNNVTVDGADFGQVRTMFERMLGPQAIATRSPSSVRKF